jgi:hypothetical protein
MFQLPWYLSGSVALSASEPDEVVLKRIAAMLDEQSRTVVHSGAHFVEFHSPIWENLFNIGAAREAFFVADHGRIWIDRRSDEARLRFSLRILHLILCGIGAGLLSAGAGYLMAGTKGAIMLGLVAFLWLGAGNIVIALFRVPRLLSRTLAEAKA